MTTRLYTLMIDSGCKPWLSGYSREFRWTEVDRVQATSRKNAVAELREANFDIIADAAAWCVLCDGAASPN